MKFLLLLLITLPCFAQGDLPDISALLDSLENFPTLVPQQECVGCRDDHDLFNRCAKKICGRPSRTNSTRLYNRNINQYTSSEDRRNFRRIKSDLKKYLKEKIRVQTDFFNNIQEALNTGTIAQTIERLRPMSLDYYASTLFKSFFELSFNSSLPASNRVQVIFNSNFETLSPTIKRGIRSYANSLKDKMPQNPVNAMSSGFYTLDEARNILQQKIDQLRSANTDTLSTNQQSSRDELLTFSIDSESSLEVLSTQLNAADSIVDRINNESNDPIIYCTDPSCKEALKGFLTGPPFQSFISESLANFSDSHMLEDQLNYCQSLYLYRSISEDSNLETEIRNRWPQVIDLFKNRLINQYSTSTQSLFDDYVNDELQFEARPLGGQNSQGENFQNLNDRSIQARTARAKSSPFDLIDISIKYYSSTTNQFVPSRNLGCGSDFQSLITDRFPAIADPFNIDHILYSSLYTARNPVEGDQIMTHELSHALSALFIRGDRSETSYRKYQEIRSCANRFYKDSVPASIMPHTHPNDNYYTEEDAADLISYQVNANVNTIYSCSLLLPESNGRDYRNLSLQDLSHADIHSESFLRVLREAINKKKALSRECQQIIEDNSDRYRFEPCI